MNSNLANLLTTKEEIKSALVKRGGYFHYKSVPHPMISSMEQEGWKLNKKNKTSARMEKPKPLAEQLEDDVWSLIAKMGFNEISADRKFTIHVGDNINPRQIDVFAKDDETALLIECTGCEAPTKKSMSGLIEKISAIKSNVRNSINKHYGKDKKLKIRWIIATRNVLWGDADLAKAAAEKIIVIRDEDIKYYQQLASHLGCGAKYQFLANVFANEDIHELKIVVPATRAKMGGNTFYSFLVSPHQLLKISYVSHKAGNNADDFDTYQRMLQPKRLKKIAEYIDNGGRFPTNIVINIETKSNLRFDIKENIGDSTLGSLYLPSKYASAWIIDGQHRLYGFSFSKFAEQSTVPVLAFVNLSPSDQANLFIDINHEQVKVPKNLLFDLFSDLKWESTDQKEKLYALASKTVKALDNNMLSPVRSRIITSGKDKDHVRCLTLTTVADAIMSANLYGDVKTGGIFKPGALYYRDKETSLKKGTKFLIEYLSLFAKSNPTNWALGSAPGGYLCTNNTIVALFRVLKAVCDYIDSKSPTLECYELDANELLEKVVQIITPLLEYLVTIPPAEMKRLRDQVGGKGQRSQSLALMIPIKERFPDFNPAGLQEYIDSFDDNGVKEGKELIDKIQLRLYEGVMARLKTAFPDGDESWWREGVPEKVRQACAIKREADTEYLEAHKQLVLIDYKSIAAHNWELFRDDFSLKSTGNREAQLSWLVELGKIRNKISHPERGRITKEEVERLKEISGIIHTKFQDVLSR